MTFKDKHREFQYIVLELNRIRNHNMSFTEGNRDLLHFAEGTLVLLALERFMRMILDNEATDKDTLPTLLQKATSERVDPIQLPGGWSKQDAIQAIAKVRNSLLHGNYEQAAQQSGLSSKEDYFRGSRYISEVEILFRILCRIIKQIDRDTGRPHPRTDPTMQNYLASPDFLDLKRTAPDEVHSPARLVQQEIRDDR